MGRNGAKQFQITSVKVLNEYRVSFLDPQFWSEQIGPAEKRTSSPVCLKALRSTLTLPLLSDFNQQKKLLKLQLSWTH